MGLHGWRLFGLVLAAVIGGYSLASGAAIFLGAVLPMARAEAVLAGTLLSFAIYTVAIIWVFSARNLKLAWLGLMLPALLLAGSGVALAGAAS